MFFGLFFFVFFSLSKVIQVEQRGCAASPDELFKPNKAEIPAENGRRPPSVRDYKLLFVAVEEEAAAVLGRL